MSECVICQSKKGPFFTTRCCEKSICVVCLTDYGPKTLVHENRRAGVKCTYCRKQLADQDLEDAFGLSGNQEYRDLKGREGMVDETIVSKEALIRNAWAFIFHCPKCGSPNGFCGEGCDLLTCYNCKNKFNPVTGDGSHTEFLSPSYISLSKVLEGDRGNQLQFAIKFHPQAAKACCFEALSDAIKKGRHAEASSHILSIAPLLRGFALHIARLANSPPRKVKKPSFRLSFGSTSSKGTLKSPPPSTIKSIGPKTGKKAPLKPTNRPTSRPLLGSSSAKSIEKTPPPSTLKKQIFKGPEAWQCAFCKTVSTTSVKCIGCGRTKWETLLKK